MGKTTLLKLINDLLIPTNGEVLINGEKPNINSKKSISYLPERTYLDKSMKISQIITFFTEFYDNFDKEKAIKLFDAGEKIIKTNNDIEHGEIIIGALSHISHFLLMDKVAQIKKDYPNIKITILTGSSGKELIQLLENHKIDFALDSTTMQIKNKDIKKETIKEIENIFISKEQLLIDNLKNLENQRLILGQENTTTSQKLVKLLQEYNVTIKHDLEIDTTELKVDATKLGLGIAYVMKDAVMKDLDNNELYKVELPIELPSSSVNLLYLKGQLSNADKKFIKDYLKK